MRLRRAFTLVELLVVIGIIALLISILLPALSRAQESGKRVGCLNNHRQLLMAVRYYADEWKDVLPFVNSNSVESGNQWAGPGWLYWRARGYGNSTDPAQHLRDIQYGVLWKYLKQPKVYRCPFDQPPYAWGGPQNLTSYCMNREVIGNFPGGPMPSYKISNFKPTDILFWESDERRSIWNDGCNNWDEGITARHGQTKGSRDSAGAIVGTIGMNAEWITVAEFEREAQKSGGRVQCSPNKRRS